MSEITLRPRHGNIVHGAPSVFGSLRHKFRARRLDPNNPLNQPGKITASQSRADKHYATLTPVAALYDMGAMKKSPTSPKPRGTKRLKEPLKIIDIQNEAEIHPRRDFREFWTAQANGIPSIASTNSWNMSTHI